MLLAGIDLQTIKRLTLYQVRMLTCEEWEITGKKKGLGWEEAQALSKRIKRKRGKE